MEGNHKALNRSEATKIVLETQGIDPDRFAVEWVSSAEAPRFADVVSRFTDKIRGIGPNPLGRRKTSAAASAPVK